MDINLDMIREAEQRIKGVVKNTSLISAPKLSDKTGMNIYLKLENLQYSGSFKIRGAANKILSLPKEELKNGVVASSAGNHAQGVALSAAKLGIKSTIVMPKIAPLAKIKATKEYGAEVVLHGEIYDDAYELAKAIQIESDATFIHPFNDPLVIAGQGTIGIEIIEELDCIDAIVIPIGGGGLISGIATAVKALKPEVKVIGVQASNAPAMAESFHEKNLHSVNVRKTMADGIAVKTPGDLTYNIIKDKVDEIVTVDENEIASAIMFLLEKCKLVSEGAGATPAAALLSGKINMPGKNVVGVLSGGNIDITLVEQIVNRGLMAEDRRFELKVNLVDRTGELSHLLAVVAEYGGNIISIRQSSTRQNLMVNEKGVTLVIDVINGEVKNQIIEKLKEDDFIIRSIT
jgi:threonine dehydratase